jgi:hypothetical protein
MGILKSTKPAWEHKDPAIRLAAVKQLDEAEQDVIAAIARNDSDEEVRLAALRKISDQQVLEDIKNHPQVNDTLLNAADDRLKNLLFKAVLLSEDEQSQLQALQRLDDEHLLADLALKVDSQEVRLQAVSRINSQEILCRLIEKQCGKTTALAALEKINDVTLFERLSSHASNKSARLAAREKLLAVTSDTPSGEKDRRRIELQELLKEADFVASHTPLDFDGNPFEELENRWEEIAPDDLYELRSSFDSIKNKFHSLAEDFKEQQEKKRQQEEQQEAIHKEAEQLCIAIEEQVGSTAVDAEQAALQIIEKWQKMKEAGRSLFSSGESPAAQLQERFDKACRSFHKNLKKIHHERETLSAFDAECARLEQLLETDKAPQASQLLVKLEKKVTETTFQFIDGKSIDDRLTQLGNKINKLQEAEAQAQRKNLEKRQQICERLEKINSEDHNRKKVQQVKKLKTAWESLSPLPQTLSNEVNDRYLNAIREFDEQQQKHQLEEEWRQWANKNKKEELCRCAEELDNASDLETIEKRVKELQRLWRESGAVYGRVSQALWKRFQDACNRNYQRCRPFLEERKQKQREMLNRKEDICKEAEQLADSSDWQKTASILKALQAEWKSLDSGPSRGKEKRLYHRFRKACNHFFARRSADFKEHDQERLKNLSTKEDLCVQAEALAAEPRLQYGREFRKLQEQWKNTGAAPRNQEEKIWKRFRAACDKYFDWLETQRKENAEAKQALCREAHEICNNLDSEEKLGETDEALEKIKSRWKQIGPVSKEQEKSLQKEFQRALDIFYAFRQECYAERDRQRQENLARKEALVERAEQIAGGPSSPEAAAELKELQKQWQTIGTAPREHEKVLFHNFQAACNAYFEGRRQEVEENQRQRLDNQKKKEGLILELENIVGISHSNEDDKQKNSVLTLAEELKIALESNIFMAGKRDDRKRQREEVKHIQQAWKKIGPTSRDQEQKLWKRYKAALDFFYAAEARKKTPRKST